MSLVGRYLPFVSYPGGGPKLAQAADSEGTAV